MDVNMIGFTGSTPVGRLILKYSAESNMKRVTLECGGKSPQASCPDAVVLYKGAVGACAAAYRLTRCRRLSLLTARIWMMSRRT